MITNELLAHNLGSVNTLLQFYNSDIEQIKLSKMGNKYSIEPVINGEQIDSFYKTMTKKEVITYLRIIEIVLCKNAHCSYSLDSEKRLNTEFLLDLLKNFNEFNA